MLTTLLALASLAAEPAAPGWEAFLSRARRLNVASVMPRRVPHPEASTRPLRQAVLVVPRQPSPGLAIALQDLARYVEHVTGKRATCLSYEAGGAIALKQVPPDATAIMVGERGSGVAQGAAGVADTAAGALLPQAPGQPGGYAIQARRVKVGQRDIEVVAVQGDDLLGAQYGVYRLMSLSGQRFYYYQDPYTPPLGAAKLPSAGFLERHAPPKSLSVRGFAPHLYHPVPLALAFHEPSPAHLAVMCKYVDWAVQTGQNTLKFELLDLDARSRLLPSSPNHRKLDAWSRYARQVLAYAHARGLKVSLNLAFANDVSNNVYAINPFEALRQTLWLDVLERDPRQGPRYAQTLAESLRVDLPQLHTLLDHVMRAPWDDISWCLGTSEFSSTNDDLTVAWMNESARYLRARYPGTTTTVISHVPGVPRTLRYGDPYFNLAEHADAAVGQLVHTTELYSFTDPAPVYGNRSFVHKLKQLYGANPARQTVYEPETSYWVSYDASVPLFLPVYMASRARDLAILAQLPHIDGQLAFTTAWEWGYWLTDYVVAELQTGRNTSLTGTLEAAFEPFGPARDQAVDLLLDVIAAQHEGLIQQGLIRDLQGASPLTELGATLRHVPGINVLLQGTNSSPERLRPAAILRADAPRLARQQRELGQLGELASSFRGFADRAAALRPSVPAAAERYFSEIADGLEIDALRAEEVHAALSAVATVRAAELAHAPGGREAGLAWLARAALARDRARDVVRRREPLYRDPPAETYARAAGPTMWNDRYLTPVHTGEFWRATYDEVAQLLGRPVSPLWTDPL